MLAETLSADSSAAGRDGRANEGSPASAAPVLPPTDNELDPLVAYTRRSSETACIFHSGYLLKRSNAPLNFPRRTSDEEGGNGVGGRSGAPLVPEETLQVVTSGVEGVENGVPKGEVELPVPPLTASEDYAGEASLEDDGNVATSIASSARTVQEAADLVAALAFGLDISSSSQNQRESCAEEQPYVYAKGAGAAPTEQPAEAEVDVPTTLAYTATSQALTPPRTSVAIPIPSAAPKNKQSHAATPLTPPYHRLNSAPAGIETFDESTHRADRKARATGADLGNSNRGTYSNTTQEHTSTALQTSSQQPAPADYIAPDGHIWRAKYCVLEDGVLYFYRNEQDGNSIEAQIERQEMSLFHNAAAAGGSSLSNQQQQGRGESHHQLEDLSKSPGPRQFKPTLLDSHSHAGATSFCHDGTVLWEKRVALDHVGEVRSAEMEYGAKSFELLAVGYEDNPNAVDESQRGDEGQINMADRLILRAGSKEDMNEWLFQFHRSLASFMKQIVNMVGSNMAGVGDLHLPEQFYPNGIGATGVLIPPAPQLGQNVNVAIPIPVGNLRPPAPKTKKSAYDTVRSYSPGSQLSSLFPESALSHGHGRSGMHRRRVRTRQNSDYMRLQSLLSPGPSPEQDKIVSASLGRIPKKGSLAYSLERNASAPGGSPPKDSSPKTGVGLALLPPRVKRISPANKDIIEVAIPQPHPSTGRYIPPHLRPKPYVPPHLRNKDSVQALSPVKPPSEGEGVPSNVPFDWTDEKAPRMNRSDGFGIQSMDCSPEELPSRPRAQSDLISPHFILGGCADPTAAIGSIEDEMYVPRKASRVGKFHTKGHGGYGGQSFGNTTCTSSDPGQNSDSMDTDEKPRKSLRWEVGAMSECGIRESNEDAYIISHDLSAAFSGWRGHHDAAFSLSEAHHFGLFAIFDGHCGNHAARYACEKLPELLFDEYKNLVPDDGVATMQQHAETMLTRAILRLDQTFCTLCYADGRDWESGATALVVLLVDDLVTVANLGDSRGLMCISRENCKGNENDDQWYILEDNALAGKETEDESKSDRPYHPILWKEITDVHSPAREDERDRIETANGWITTETEIPISQLQRIDFLDADVVEILRRCFSDRFDDSDPSADVHRAGKQCNAEPGRLLHISRVCGELAVSRAIGDRDFKAAFNRDLEAEGEDVVENRYQGEPGWESPLFLPYPEDHNRRFEGDLVSSFPEFRHHRAGAEGHSNEFLLLACDGLWDVMDADDAVRVARDLLFEKGWPAQKAAARLAELAMHLGSSDNITVIVVRFFTGTGGRSRSRSTDMKA
mmetsp:Transcript_10834/g.30441  ORF Transcript_10834/g.30441 Transcript_10834/m.30441 type:complete len:1296 (+) Transcript_10834:166-4053(+)